jgi:Raf kinase inhibitor-like YbhB/YbcL family protein
VAGVVQEVGSMRLTSPAVETDGKLPAQFTCDGEDVSPPLEWSGIPGDAAELVLHLRDPDAPGGTFTHWIVYGIDPAVTGLEQGSVPEGAREGATNFGRNGYGGPCPPAGPAHRYIFTLLAVSEPLGLEPGASIEDVESAAADVTLATAELKTSFSR